VELLTITQAAERAQISRKAMARRVERGTVPSKIDAATGRRVIPAQVVPGNPETGEIVPVSGVVGGGEPHGEPRIAADLSPILARLEQLAAEVGRYRALAQVAESTEQRLADELHQVRAERDEARAALELATHSAQRRRRWWSRQAG
jgi:hypothetical protein